MENIESVRIEKTLKAGKTVWDVGTILDAPFPEEILMEISAKSPAVKILKQGRAAIKSVPVQKGKLKGASTGTTLDAPIKRMVEKPEVKPKPIKKKKLVKKPKLVKRKKK